MENNNKKSKSVFLPPTQSMTGFNSSVYTVLAVLSVCVGGAVFYLSARPTNEIQSKTSNHLDSANVLSTAPLSFDKIPDYIPQENISISQINNSSNTTDSIKEHKELNKDFESNLNNTKRNVIIGDQDVNSIVSKNELEEAARTSNSEPEKLMQQLKSQKDVQVAEEDEIYLGTRKKTPKSPYEVMAGTFIPATLETGLNSDLPGYSTAVVRQNVYDTVTGNFLLIPKGTKIFGKYESKIAYGQKRLLIDWNRLIFSDGASILLKGMAGTDKAGYAGFHDQVDNHFANLMSGAILMSIIGAGAQLSQPQTPTGVSPSQNQSVGQTMAGQVGTQLSQIAGQVVQKNMETSPTITIRPGYEFNIVVNKDMILEPITQTN